MSSTALSTLFGTQVPALKLENDALTDALAGGGGTSRRISLEGGAFREIIGGKEVNVAESRTMEIVIVNAAPVSRMYYAGTYQPGKTTPPTCWSSDTKRPDANVAQAQHITCNGCPQDIKGSGQNDTKACRFSQRLAVALPGTLAEGHVYQLQVPAKSIFGDTENGKMPLQAYGRFLKSHNTHAVSIVTEMRFDVASSPKLIFKAVRPLNQEELQYALAMRDSEEAQKAVRIDVVKKEETVTPSAPFVSYVAPVVSDSTPEPTVRKEEAKTAPPPPSNAKANLAAKLVGWDD